MKHLWKEFAKMIGAPYRKRFSTNGYGDMRIDNKGLYIYSEGKNDFCGYWSDDYDWTGWRLDGLISGVIKVEEVVSKTSIE